MHLSDAEIILLACVLALALAAWATLAGGGVAPLGGM